MVDLPTGWESAATAINNSGQIVGFSYGLLVGPNGRESAFLYSAGSVTDLGTLGGNCAAYDINDPGLIVGLCGFPGRAFLYFDGSMIDLNTVVTHGAGWNLQNANAINNNGQIVGSGIFNGQQRAFLLTPVGNVPEPSTFMLAGLGLASAVFLSRRFYRG